MRPSSAPQQKRLVPAQAVRWSVEATGLLVVGAQRSLHRIGYPEAAVWDLLTRRHSLERCAELVGHIAGLPIGEATSLVDRTVREFVRLGLLEECP